jgi:hypothetical protein
MRTDDVARRIEYVTGKKWTADQYAKVCGILRLYRHESVLDMLKRGSKEDATKDFSGPKNPKIPEQSE